MIFQRGLRAKSFKTTLYFCRSETANLLDRLQGIPAAVMLDEMMRSFFTFWKVRAAILSLFFGMGMMARADQTIYSDALANSWENWGWATLNYNATTYVHGGTKSISVSGSGYEAIYWHHPAFNSSAYTTFSFWINGGASGGQLLQVQALLNGVATTNIYNLPTLAANSWQQISIPLSALGAANKPNLDGFWIQDRSNGSFLAFYVDDVSLISAPAVPLNITISIDAARNRHAIAPYIYGVAFASSNDLADLNVPLHRSGGNATTRYNWQQNAHQTAFDYFFQSLPDSGTAPGASADAFISDSRNGGAEPMITIPTIGWVADVTTNRIKRWSFSVAKYGAQTDNEYSFSGGQFWASADSGNGISAATGQPITTNNPADANVAVTSTFQRGWIQHLTNRWNMATNGGLHFYTLDNEPSIWQSTHRDVFRTGATMEQIRDRMIDYGSMIKAIDPGAILFGPEEWGWSGYLYSGYDQQYSATNNYSVFPDKTAHGNWEYLPWLLDQMRRTNNASGQRLLDVFSVHYYPQSGEFSTNVTSDMQLLRNRSTRSLWDTNYTDESWINTSVQLIPRLKLWVQTNYPGTKTALTEYSWGADDHINGATAQADVLGILGREGIDFATRWTSPTNVSPTYKAFKMYRNYDGQKSTFGNVSVFAQTTEPDELSVFAAQRTNDSALTVMVINKALATNYTVPLQITNFLLSSTGTVWRLNSSNSITRLADVTNVTAKFNYTFPAQSITLLVIPQRTPGRPRLNVGGISSTNQFGFSLVGEAGVTYVIESSTNLVNWTPLSTNLLSTNYTNVIVSGTAPAKFYRAIWQP